MNFDPTAFELPRQLRALLDTDAAAGLPRRSFLKLGAVSGFALGAFPLAASAQDAAKPAAAGLKPIEQPLAFVRIDRDGTTTITINRLDFGQASAALGGLYALTGLLLVVVYVVARQWNVGTSEEDFLL